ncbi:MAG TPA: hypothetical protein VFF12_13725, partial [Myxococcaceae bacterium]|nr:hypothetical protein [Myxococcaceae bacterium]
DREERLEYRPGSDSQFPEHYLSAGPRTVYLPPGPLGGERGVVVAPDPRIAEGQVIDQETGEPLPSALVRRVMADLADHDFDTDWGFFPEFDRFTVTADAAGRFRYPWAIDGTPVLVTHPGFGRRLVLLSRNPGQRIGLDRTPSISLSVASDALLSCVAVQNPASRHEGLRYVVIPRGESVNVDGLLEGRWTLHLGCDPDSRPVRTLDVQAGRRYPVALEARRSP